MMIKHNYFHKLFVRNFYQILLFFKMCFSFIFYIISWKPLNMNLYSNLDVKAKLRYVSMEHSNFNFKIIFVFINLIS